jgi:tRNA (cytidine/uridine-2'-O-)-methyltransferase
MLPNHFHIGLFEPEIPQNTGSIARLAAATQNRLHIVKPLGFSGDDRNLKRAGLDYWRYLDLEMHQSIEELLDLFSGKFAFLSKHSDRPYTSIPKETELLVFGKETTGLPESLWKKYPKHFYSIAMFHDGVRSLNLANTVSIVTYRHMESRGLI